MVKGRKGFVELSVRLDGIHSGKIDKIASQPCSDDRKFLIAVVPRPVVAKELLDIELEFALAWTTPIYSIRCDINVPLLAATDMRKKHGVS